MPMGAINMSIKEAIQAVAISAGVLAVMGVMAWIVNDELNKLFEALHKVAC